ncbi:MAG: class I SAM-dependent methyltransferase, partial [Gammaproteobacteria bacterium]
MIDPGLKKVLADRISLGIESMPGLPPALPVGRFVDYLELLESWSRAYNLTAIRDPGRMVTHHVLDSLSVLPYLR